MKEKSILLSKYFEIKKPTYAFLKLTPMKSIRNYNSDKLAKVIASLYKAITKCIYRFEGKFIIESQTKVSYYKYHEKRKAEFYFIVS